jgi:hypothetical protein
MSMIRKHNLYFMGLGKLSMIVGIAYQNRGREFCWIGGFSFVACIPRNTDGMNDTLFLL